MKTITDADIRRIVGRYHEIYKNNNNATKTILDKVKGLRNTSEKDAKFTKDDVLLLCSVCLNLCELIHVSTLQAEADIISLIPSLAIVADPSNVEPLIVV